MRSENGQEHATDVRRVLEQINQAWVQRRPEELVAWFHEGMVVILPGFQGRVEGRNACIDGYRDFVRQATIHDYQESDHQVDVWGETAVASYHFELAYEMDGHSYRDTGRDLFVFTRERGQWLATWRTLVG